MEPLENIVGTDYEVEINELSSETPVGWSSICLDQTINYYIDCNSTNIYEKKIFENVSKDLA
uniref:Uncharacterized protein n=1 Tax=Riquetophycus sp. TaxID=1897556 RepID=A0A1C9C841_9FLOR|nr:hypothetical protein Riqu_060 [Riquetophycus sp.]